MKSPSAISCVLLVSALCAFISGCLFKPALVTPRRFVLAPMRAESRAGETYPLAVGLGRITIPEYLLKDSMAIRRGDNEIEYLEDALWAEGLDQSFQRALAANLSSQLGDASIRLSSWQPGEVALAVRVSVERLDVDAEGRGTLFARWEIESPDTGKVLNSGESSLNKSGPAPYAEPATIATTLSDLTAQFSGVLAKALRESVPTGATR